MDSSVRKAEKVVVAVRVRKLIDRERNANAKKHWRTVGNSIQQVQPDSSSSVCGSAATPHIFDHVFGEEAPTRELYDRVVAPVVAKSFDGFNGTVLCYGQTSSGKTHTLYGSETDPGLITMMAQDLFHRTRNNTDRLYYIKLGLLEIYNEKMSDLLSNGQPVEDVEIDGVVIPKDLKAIDVFSPEDIFNAAQQIQEQRKTGETLMNKRSSRSHTILRMVIESVPRECNNNDDQLISAILNFVDLAGSEKSSQTGATGDRLQEANYINKSLTSLCKVVTELSKAGTGGTIKKPESSNGKRSKNSSNTNTNNGGSCSTSSTKRKFINFRDSKLTRILQSSLNGSAFVVMICNLTPASVNESLSTLRFAKAAKDIKIDPTQNTKYLTATDEYQIKILELEALLRKKSTEIEDLHSRIHVMQTFHKVCSPAPVRSTKQLASRRQTTGIVDKRRPDVEGGQSANKEPSLLTASKTVEMPVEEISQLKKIEAQLVDENVRLRKELKEAEGAVERSRASYSSVSKILKDLRAAMQNSVQTIDKLQRDNLELKQLLKTRDAETKEKVDQLQAEIESVTKALEESKDSNARDLQRLQHLESKWPQVHGGKSTLKVNRSVQTLNTAITSTVGVQTSDHIEPIKYIHELKSFARKKEQELVVTKDYYEKTVGTLTEKVMHLQNEVRRKSGDNLLTQM